MTTTSYLQLVGVDVKMQEPGTRRLECIPALLSSALSRLPRDGAAAGAAAGWFAMASADAFATAAAEGNRALLAVPQSLKD